MSVEGEDLSTWSRPTAGSLRLRFDGVGSGPNPNRREVRLTTWLPALTDPMATSVPPQDLEIPWLHWNLLESKGATLSIASMGRFQIAQVAGVVPVTPPAVPAEGSVPRIPTYRATYRVDRPEGPGRLTWEIEPARVSVQVESQLTLLSETAEWVASIRYDVSGGAASLVHLRLPTEWAANARLSVEGQSYHISPETRGASTFWIIRPEHPIWGEQRLVVRATMPLPRHGDLLFPELIPLGRGAADTYLALIDASGNRARIEASTGLQPVVSEGRFRAREFASALTVAPQVFHVRLEAWTLRVLDPYHARTSARFDGEPARVSLAEQTCTLRTDRSIVGMAAYEVLPRSGSFLTIEAPARSSPIWASINGDPVIPLKDSDDHWMLPVDSASDQPARARLIWTTPPDETLNPAKDSRSIPLPRVMGQEVPIYLSIHAPGNVSLDSPDHEFDPIALERLEIERVEGLSREIVASLKSFENNSPRDGETLTMALVEFEVAARAAELAAYWNDHQPVSSRVAHLARIKGRNLVAPRR